jgi:hypothetical protein
MPAHAIDYTGQKHGLLTAIENVGYKNGKRLWRCRCDCGNETTIPSARLGLTLSCGCIQRSAVGTQNSLRTRKPVSQSTEYKSWRSMLNRCYVATTPNFYLYGGRGVCVFEEWRGKGGFEKFAKYMGKRPKGCSLDRHPNKDGNYEPGNVRWATAEEQSNNRRDTPEYRASRIASLNKGRERMWSDPEIRARLMVSRRGKRKK